MSIPNADSVETPASGVGVIALPYDRDSVLAQLEARATTPRPRTEQLDRLFARFREPFTLYTRATYSVDQIRDSLARLRSLLDSTSRQSPQYGELQRRWDRLNDSLPVVQERSTRARAALSRARGQFLTRSESLRAAIRQWQDSTYQGYDSIVEKLARDRGLEPVTDTTDATGWARVSLPSGRWWIFAHAWDTGDPNAEWYWNLPVESDTILLSSRTGRRRPRY